jgi:hypothetical protein
MWRIGDFVSPLLRTLFHRIGGALTSNTVAK